MEIKKYIIDDSTLYELTSAAKKAAQHLLQTGHVETPRDILNAVIAADKLEEYAEQKQ